MGGIYRSKQSCKGRCRDTLVFGGDPITSAIGYLSLYRVPLFSHKGGGSLLSTPLFFSVSSVFPDRRDPVQDS